MIFIGFDFSDLHLHIRAVLAQGENYTFSMNRKRQSPTLCLNFYHTQPSYQRLLAF